MKNKSKSESTDSTPIALRAQGLSKKLNGNWIVKNFSCNFRGGCLNLVTGANGSGKTTLLRLLAGIYRPERGEVKFSDSGLTTRQSLRRVGFSGTSPFLYGDLTVDENLRLFLELGGGSKKFLQKLLVDFELLAHQDTTLRQCSTGVRRKAGIVRAVIGLPSLLVFDEPLAFLDERGKVAFFNLVKNLIRLEKIVVVSSNQIESFNNLESECKQIFIDRGVSLEV